MHGPNYQEEGKEEDDRMAGSDQTTNPAGCVCVVQAKRMWEGDQKKGDDDKIVLRSGLHIHIHTFYLIMIFCFDSPSIIDFYSAPHNRVSASFCLHSPQVKSRLREEV